ncbi:MAG: hypothetical protein IJM96_00060 [Clostridia bacterium]|nr:hypothetical protein [Clostridia bacterium]
MKKYLFSKLAMTVFTLLLASLFIFGLFNFDLFPDRTEFKSLGAFGFYSNTRFYVYDDDIVRVYTFDEYFSDEYWDFLIPQWGEKHTYRHNSNANLVYLGYKSFLDMHKLKFSHLRSIDRSDLNYTYSDVFERIYKIKSADEIASISSGNTHITDKAEIARLYDIISASKWLTSVDTYNSRQYSCHSISFTLTNGETIDILNYDHRERTFFADIYASSSMLSDEDAEIIETLFNIETYWKYQKEV